MGRLEHMQTLLEGQSIYTKNLNVKLKKLNPNSRLSWNSLISPALETCPLLGLAKSIYYSTLSLLNLLIVSYASGFFGKEPQTVFDESFTTRPLTGLQERFAIVCHHLQAAPG